jgi:multiple sugar transport system substrate-binding protein
MQLIKKRTALVLIFFLLSVLELQPESLRLWIMPNGDDPIDAIESVTASFTEQTGIDVETRVVDWGVAFNEISEALAGDDPPQILQLGTTWVPWFASLGYLAELPPNDDALGFTRFNKTILQTCSIHGDDRLYSVPWFMDIRALYYNASWFKEASGMDEAPASYDEFIACLEALRKKGLALEDGSPVYPIGFPGKNDWNVLHNFAPWVWSEGGAFIVENDDVWQSGLMQPATVAGIYHYLALALKGYNSPVALRENSSEIQQRFSNREFAVIQSISDQIDEYQTVSGSNPEERRTVADDGLFISGYPAGRAGRYTFTGGSNIAVTARYAGDTNTRALLKFLIKPDTLDGYCRRIGFVPPDESLWPDWERDPLYGQVIETGRSGRTYPTIPNWGPIEEILVNCLGELWSLIDSGMITRAAMYETLNRYDKSIDARLGFETADTGITFEAFNEILDRLDQEISSPVGRPGPAGFWKWAIPSVAIALVSVGFVLLVLLLKKRKNKTL